MRQRLFVICFVCCFVSLATAAVIDFNNLWPSVMSLIKSKQDSLDVHVLEHAKIEQAQGVSGFTSPIGPHAWSRSLFDETSPTIRRRSLLRAGRSTRTFLTTLIDENITKYPFSQRIEHFAGEDYKVYWREGEIFVYMQQQDKGDVSLKEWAYLIRPNQPWGSQYKWRWDTDQKGMSIQLELVGDRVNVLMLPEALQAKIKNPLSVITDPFNSNVPQILATVTPPIYWTKAKTQKQGTLSVKDNELTLTLQEPASAYPILLDPSLSYAQWFGKGTHGVVVINALAVTADEIYAGGVSDGPVWNEIVSFNGTWTESSEGFVVEIDESSGSPVINWGQWLGGTGLDAISALAITGDEIYAGGYAVGTASGALTGMEGLTSFVGTLDNATAASEGFVVEIDESSGSPVINWGQWLGGTSFDVILALAITGDEIYAGGYAAGSAAGALTNMEGLTAFSGTIDQALGQYEGYVVEIDESSGSPAIKWGQWLGGTNDDGVQALAVVGNEVYVGGFAAGSAAGPLTNMEGLTAFSGTIDQAAGQYDGYVVEIDESSGSPAIKWGQWLGGTQTDIVYVLGVTADEIYAGGYVTGSAGGAVTNMEGLTAFSGTMEGTSSGNEGFVVEIDESSSSPIIRWGQWLGGTSSDRVFAIAVTGNEIYVGGYLAGTAGGALTNMEGLTAFSGTMDNTAGQEGFVVEIDETTGSPVIKWGQWFGGAASDQVKALALINDEIYLAGYVVDSASNMEGLTSFSGVHNQGSEGFVVEIDESSSSPVINWGQWLGGGISPTASVLALAVTGNEIYAGGKTLSPYIWPNLSSFSGTATDASEGFVVEVYDGYNPSISWGQWLGGSNVDTVNALAVVGNEIYAGGAISGTSGQMARMESATAFVGTVDNASAVSEGFVVEIDESSGSPVINWGQWLGGTHNDVVQALAVTGDEIYAGGFVLATAAGGVTNMEGLTAFSGTLQGVIATPSEGFVVEIDESSSNPVINWGQWLGGTNDDSVLALVVVGNEIYAGGFISGSAAGLTNMEGLTAFSGTIDQAAQLEGYVVEIDENSGSPAIKWGQWLGGTANDVIYALGVTADEIYAGGYAVGTAAGALTNMEGLTAFSGTMDNTANQSDGLVVEIDESSSSPIIRWGQWLGGTSSDQVLAIAVTGNEIYVGGYVQGTAAGPLTNMDGLTSFSGTIDNISNGSQEGFVVEIDESTGSPVIKWGQWLGGTDSDRVMALALTGDEIYIGGFVANTASFESVFFSSQGLGSSSGFVIEANDSGSPQDGSNAVFMGIDF